MTRRERVLWWMRWHNRFTDMEALIRRIERGKVTWAEFMEKRGQTAPIA